MDTLFFLHALLSSAAAVVFAVVLVEAGMLLAPIQAWIRARHRAAWERCHEAALSGLNDWQALYDTSAYSLDERLWWKPLWGCATCVAGQWGFWAYLCHYHAIYQWWAHAYFVALAILFSLVLQKLVSWTKN